MQACYTHTLLKTALIQLPKQTQTGFDGIASGAADTLKLFHLIRSYRYSLCPSSRSPHTSSQRRFKTPNSHWAGQGPSAFTLL